MRALLTACLAIFSAVSAVQAAPGAPWERARFTAPPQELLAAAKSEPAPADVDVLTLISETRVSFDGEGRRTTTEYEVVRVITEEGAKYYTEISADYQPWVDDKPSIRARVIGADGRVTELDQKTIDDAPAGDEYEIYSDARVLQAPIPAVAVGSVIEHEIVTKEHAASFARGVSARWWIGGFQASRASRLILDAPSTLPLKYAVHGQTLEPRMSELNGRRQAVWESGPMDAWKTGEAGMPSDVARHPFIQYSTGESWQAVASQYGEIVDEQIRNADLASLMRGIKTKGRPREAVITDLVMALHHAIRYTGVEFSEASIIPRTPAETIKRGYGDCKDKSALLIAMLRSAGIDAYAALLAAGPGLDVDPALPGLGLFNHVIVHVPGTPALWIDATDEFSRVGVVPSGDEGRLTLVAARSTTALVKVPESTSRDNRLVEERQIVLSDFGKGHIVETSHPTGTIESEYRSSYAGAKEKDSISNLETYSETTYLSKKVSGFRVSDARDLAKPFELRFEVSDAARASTDLGEAVVAMFPYALSGRLPYALRPADSTQKSDGDAKEKAREHDFVFDEPFTTEFRYRIVPPAGFKAASLPESKSTPIGTATLTTEFSTGSDGAIVAVLRFDSGKRRMTAAEFTATRAAVAKLVDEPAVLVRLEHTGQAALERGDVRAALDIMRVEVKKQPGKATPRVRMALALLEAGLGEEARAEIAAAAAIEPKNPLVIGQQGFILQHDLLGRPMSEGYDRAGALAAYKKVTQLDPDDILQRVNYAIVLEHDAKGVRYGCSAEELNAAIEEYRKIGDRIGELGEDYRANLPSALMHAGRYDEMVAAVKADREVPDRQEFLLLGDILSGDAKHVEEAVARSGFERPKRSESLRKVAQTLISLRRYPEAAIVLTESAKGSRDAAAITAQAGIIRKVRRSSEIELSPSDPVSIVKRLLIVVFDPKSTPAQMLDLFVKPMDKEDADTIGDLMRSPQRAAQARSQPPEVICDVALAVAQFSVDGNDQTGYRVRFRGANAQGGSAEETLFVTGKSGDYKILASEYSPQELGREALKRVDAGDLAGARQYIEWAREDVPRLEGDDPLASDPLAVLWKKGLEGDEKQIRRAAATLLARWKQTSAQALPLLKSARDGASPEELTAIDNAILAAGRNLEDAQEVLAVASRLHAAHPDSDIAMRYHVAALEKLGRRSEAEDVLRARLAANGSDVEAIRLMMVMSASAGRYADSKSMFDKLVSLGEATSGDYNEVAWISIATGHPEDGIELAQQAVNLGGSRSPAILNTLAALYAETGQTTQAKLTVWKALDLRSANEPREEDWYVLGRMAEQYGLPDIARKTYAKIPKDDKASDLSIQAYASHRLKVLAEKPSKR